MTAPVTRLRAAEQRLWETAEGCGFEALRSRVYNGQDQVIGRSEGDEYVAAACELSEDATYFALMSPPVALALADWMAAEVDAAETYIAFWADTTREVHALNRAVSTEAVAVADAVLGSET